MDEKIKVSTRLLNETPEVVGQMALVIGSGGSLDIAVRNIASEGPSSSKSIFKDIVDNADTRVEPDIRSALGSSLSSLPPSVSSYSMAVRMMISASDTTDPAERERLISDARSVALSGLREAGKSYSSSLNAPCMIVFGVGIMVPMVLMSVLPMLGMTGTFGASALDSGLLSLITLVLIPAAVAMVMMTVRSRNPFLVQSEFDFRSLTPLAAFIVSVPVFILISRFLDTAPALCISLAVGSICALVSILPDVREERERKKKEEALKEAVFDMGNHLLSGAPFEEAFRRAASVRGGCIEVADALDAEMSLCRGDVVSAVRNAVGEVSQPLAGIYCDICRASQKDIRDSGRLALSLGRQIMDQDAVRRGIRSDLRGMTDTMMGTAAVFAPHVLGLSVTILGPVSRLSGGVDSSGTSMVLSIYLVELCALISCMLTFLSGEGGAEGAVRRFVCMLPVSMAVFLMSFSLVI